MAQGFWEALERSPLIWLMLPLLVSRGIAILLLMLRKVSFCKTATSRLEFKCYPRFGIDCC